MLFFWLTGSCSSRKGLNGACSVHEYTGSFMGQNVRFKMTSVCGHVMSLDFIGKCLIFVFMLVNVLDGQQNVGFTIKAVFFNVLQGNITTGIKSIQPSCLVKHRLRKRKQTPNWIWSNSFRWLFTYYFTSFYFYTFL